MGQESSKREPDQTKERSMEFQMLGNSTSIHAANLQANDVMDDLDDLMAEVVSSSLPSSHVSMAPASSSVVSNMLATEASSPNTAAGLNTSASLTNPNNDAAANFSSGYKELSLDDDDDDDHTNNSAAAAKPNQNAAASFISVAGTALTNLWGSLATKPIGVVQEASDNMHLDSADISTSLETDAEATTTLESTRLSNPFLSSSSKPTRTSLNNESRVPSSVSISSSSSKTADANSQRLSSSSASFKQSTYHSTQAITSTPPSFTASMSIDPTSSTSPTSIIDPSTSRKQQPNGTTLSTSSTTSFKTVAAATASVVPMSTDDDYYFEEEDRRGGGNQKEVMNPQNREDAMNGLIPRVVLNMLNPANICSADAQCVVQ